MDKLRFVTNSNNPQLAAASLSAGYGAAPVLDSISLSISAGEFICLSGRNGCGKSTLLSLLAGITPPELRYSGQVTFNSQPVEQMQPCIRAKHIAYMPQNEHSAWNYTVEDIILSGRFCHTNGTGIYSPGDYETARQAAAELHLEHLYTRPVYTLSGGEFQRVRIARAFAQQPDILLLDEPAANLDFAVRFSLLAGIKKLAGNRHLGVLISIHDVNLAAAFADTLILMSPFSTGKQNQLISGSPAKVITPENLGMTFEKTFGVYTHPEYGCPVAYVKL